MLTWQVPRRHRQRQSARRCRENPTPQINAGIAQQLARAEDGPRGAVCEPEDRYGITVALRGV